MNERHTGKVSVHDLVHLGVRPDFEQLRKLELDLSEWSARGDFQHKGGVAKQRSITNCGNESVGRSLDEFETNSATAKPGAQKILQIAHHRPEDVLEIIVVIGRVVARSTFGCCEGGKLADQSQELLEQTFRVQITRGTIVLQNRDVPIQELQDEIIDTLKAAAGSGVGCVARELFKLVVDPADHPVDPAVHDRMGIANEDRRNVFFIKYDLLVPNFKDAGDAEADVSGFGGLAKLVAQPRISD